MKKQYKKYLPIIFVFLAVALIVPIPQASASTNYGGFDFSGATFCQTLGAVHPSDGSVRSATSETIKFTSNIYQPVFQIQLKGITDYTPVANVTIALYEPTSQAYNAKPDTLLATSSLMGVESMGKSGTIASYSNTEYTTFSWGLNYNITANHYYSLVVYVQSATVIDNSGNVIMVHTSGNTISSYNGYSSYYSNGVWSTPSANKDMAFLLWGDSEYTPEATPTPTPTPYSSVNPTADPLLKQFTIDMIDFLVPLCLLLLPAVVGAWALGKSGAAKWGFIAGLNIGAILSYLYLDAFGIWAIIIIIIVDILMVFSSTRQGGD